MSAGTDSTLAKLGSIFEALERDLLPGEPDSGRVVRDRLLYGSKGRQRQARARKFPGSSMDPEVPSDFDVSAGSEKARPEGQRRQSRADGLSLAADGSDTTAAAGKSKGQRGADPAFRVSDPRAETAREHEMFALQPQRGGDALDRADTGQSSKSRHESKKSDRTVKPGDGKRKKNKASDDPFADLMGMDVDDDDWPSPNDDDDDDGFGSLIKMADLAL